MTRNLEAIAML